MKWAIEQTLPCVEKMVLLALSNFHNAKSGRCFPGKPSIADMAGVSRRTVDGALQRLRTKGMIEFESTNGGVSNEYKLNLTPQIVQGSTPQEMQGGSTVNPAAPAINPAGDAANPAGAAPEPGITRKEPKNIRQRKSTDVDLELAEMIFQGVTKLNPNHKPPNMDVWADDIRKLREIDKRTPEQIRSVFTWASQDGFWQSNILCPEKLRKQFDTLLIKMGSSNPGSGKGDIYARA